MQILVQPRREKSKWAWVLLTGLGKEAGELEGWMLELVIT